MTFRYQTARRLARWFAGFVSPELRQGLKNRLKAVLKAELKAELAVALKAELAVALKAELKVELTAELKAALKAELTAALAPMAADAMQRQLSFVNDVSAFKQRVHQECSQAVDEESKATLVERLSNEWRMLVRQAAGLPSEVPQTPSLTDLIQEIGFLRSNQELLAPVFKVLAHKRALFAGQCYYNAWYLSRALRDRGWKADVLNWDMNPTSQIYYHGEDISFDGQSPVLTEQMLQFYVSSLYAYDIFHFSNAQGICFGWPVQNIIEQHFSKHAEITLIKELGRKIVYTNNGCLDGVSQTAFAKWGPESVCSICSWRNVPTVCSDERNLAWGRFRNSVADYQCTLGGNQVDYNDDQKVHEVPEFYCLDTEFWTPHLDIPDSFLLSNKSEETLWLYHGVGNKKDRTSESGVNIHTSHVYFPLVEKLKQEGMPLEILSPSGMPNKEIRFLQAQSDIFLDMLTYGWFGAMAREGMMLGKPVICYIRPEWLESVRQEIPDYAAELPIISATPDTVEEILRDLIANPEKRREIGQRSREFAVKWHSAEAGGRRFDKIYSKLLQGNSLLRAPASSEFARE